MLLKKILPIALVTLATGCANTGGLEQEVSTLSNKVDKLTMEISKLKVQQEKQNQAIEQLKRVDKKTAQKLNNVAASYKK